MDALPAPADESRTLELVRRVQRNEAGAWDELYRAYHDELLFLTRARLGAKLRAALESEDVLQSVALEAFRELARFEPRGTGSLRRFLHTLVLNKIRDRADTFGAAKRAGAVPLSDSLADTLADPAGPSYADPVFERLERALAELPDEMREIVVLRRIEGLTSQEVAARLAKSDDAVRQLYSRGLARLALRIGELERS
jgi:RNA polymerase sigma-70 factor (ECF subfamily)